MVYNYDFKLSNDTSLTATLLGDENIITGANATASVGGIKPQKIEVREEAVSLGEGNLATMTTLNNASQTIAWDATKSAISANTDENSINSFGAINAGYNRYKTGSYIDNTSVNVVAGVVLGKELNHGKLLVGPFVEFGHSDYETHNDFSSGHLKGEGEGKYYGIGALARFDLNDFKGSHPYMELSVRFGRNNNDFSNDLGAGYDISSNYYGLHTGLGYIINSDTNSFDIYAKYFFTHLKGANTTLATGERFSFDCINSHKIQLGIKYSKEIKLSNGAIIAPYIGAGWQKEFSGDAKATTNALAIIAPSLKGNSAIMEIGVNIAKSKGIRADIGLKAHAGVHKGINANAILGYEF